MSRAVLWNEKCLYVSTLAVPFSDGIRFDLYENENSVALLEVREGQYVSHAVPKHQKWSLRSVMLCRYLDRRFPADREGLAVLWDMESRAALIGRPEDLKPFRTGGFRRVDLQVIRKLQQVVSGDLFILSGDVRHYSAYQSGGVIAMVRDRRGCYHKEYRGRLGFIRSAALTSYCRALWQCDTPYRREFPWGHAYSAALDALLHMPDLAAFQPLILKEAPPKPVGLELRQNWSVRLSAGAASLLGARCAAYLCGDWLGLEHDEEGDISIGKDGSIYLPKLYTQLTMCFPNAERVELRDHGGFLVAEGAARRSSPIPPKELFCRLLVT